MDYFKIGQEIRKARKARALSQEELAEMVNISTTHMSHIETGKTKLSLQVLVDIAAVLHAGVDTLLTAHDTAPTTITDEITDILQTCSPQESRVLMDILRAAKRSMDQHL